MGAEVLKELQWFGVLQGVGGNIEHVYNQRRVQSGDLPHSDRDAGRRPEGQRRGSPDDRERPRSDLAVRQRHVVGGPLHGQRRRALGSLQWLAPGAELARFYDWTPVDSSSGEDLCRRRISSPGISSRRASAWSTTSPAMGKTVLKGNYGLFWHNPGVGVPDNVNPNTGTKSATYGWDDRSILNGRVCRDASTATAAGSWVKKPRCSRPRSKVPRASTRTSRRRTRTRRRSGSSASCATRSAFVPATSTRRKTICWRSIFRRAALDVYATSGVPFNFIDNGVDGVRGTADDRNITMVGLPSANAATLFPTTQVQMNLPQFARYKTAETVVQQALRQQVVGLVGRRLHLDARISRMAIRRTRISRASRIEPTWDLKASGSYDAPSGIRLSPVLRHQSGANYARTGTITVPDRYHRHRARRSTSSHERQSRGQHLGVRRARREDRELVTAHPRSRLFLDLFNITNSHASRNDQPRDRHGLSAAVDHPGAVHRAASGSGSSGKEMRATVASPWSDSSTPVGESLGGKALRRRPPPFFRRFRHEGSLTNVRSRQVRFRRFWTEVLASPSADRSCGTLARKPRAEPCVREPCVWKPRRPM